MGCSAVFLKYQTNCTNMLCCLIKISHYKAILTQYMYIVVSDPYYVSSILSDPKLLSKCSHKRGQRSDFASLREALYSILFVGDYFLLLFSALSVLHPV